MTLSVNTNVGAMIALQYLNKTTSELTATQNHVNSGLKIATAKDNGAIFAIAQNMRGDVSAFHAVSDSLNRAVSATDVAMSAGQAVSDLLVEMKGKAVAASDASLDTASRNALDEDFASLRDQVTNILENAIFNGVNLVDGTSSSLTALISADGGSTITIDGEDMSLGGSIVSISAGASLSTASAASTMIGTINTSLENVNAALARLGSSSKQISIQNEFIGKLIDTLNAGIGNLVDADLATESAKLQSLQVKQQLGVQALAIANSAPAIALSLFR
jgi:flagellin